MDLAAAVAGFLGFGLGVLRQAPVLAVAALVFAVLAGFGRGLGLPLLFWRTTHGRDGEKARARALVGMAVGVLLGACALVGSLSEATMRQASIHWFLGTFRVSSLLAGGLLLLMGVPRVRQALHRGVTRGVREMSGGLEEGRDAPPVGGDLGGDEGTRTVWHLPLGGVLGVAGLWAAVEVLVRRLPESPSPHPVVAFVLTGALAPRDGMGELPGAHATAALLVGLGAAVFGVLAALNRLARWRPYPAAALCLVLAAIVAVEGFLSVRVRPGTAALFLVLLLGYAWVDGRWQRARARGLAGPPSAPPATGGLVPDELALAAWCARHGEKKAVLVVVAADGGGIRAAVWTAAVLARIEEGFRGFPAHVRLITGASGGMLGATYWVATLTPGGEHHDPVDTDFRGVLDGVQRGGLSAVVSGLVFRDLWPPPLRRGPDRGTELECAWEANCPMLRRTVGDLAEGERGGWRPSLVLTPMVVEDGRRLVISNLDLGPLLEHGTVEGSPIGLSRSGYQALAIWPSAAGTLHLSTAVRLQANFPWVLPSTEIPPLVPHGPRCRVVDAGYYDETGVDLACAWLRHHAVRLREETTGVLLLQVRDTSSIHRRQSPGQDRPAVVRGLDGLLTPVSSVLRARDATTWYRNDAAVADLSTRFAAQAGPGFFTTAIAEFGGEASLSWSLTDEEAQEICGYVRRPDVDAVLDGVVRRLQARA